MPTSRFSRAMMVGAAVGAVAAGLLQSARAQSAPNGSPQQPPSNGSQQQQLPPQPQQPSPQQQSPQQSTWQQLPHMQLERQFAGPLQDTVVQRWRDPVDGTICYIYLPITAPHSPPTASGYVQYGANTIGSISCAQGEPAKPANRTAPAPRRSGTGHSEQQ
jgi:hypothetical protein